MKNVSPALIGGYVYNNNDFLKLCTIVKKFQHPKLHFSYFISFSLSSTS